MENSEEEAVITFLRCFAGFSYESIESVIKLAKKNKVSIKLASFYGSKRLYQCIPLIELADVERILYHGGTHPRANTNACPSCWLLKQPGAPIGDCKTHDSEKIAVKRFLKLFAGFSNEKINVVIELANKNRIPIKLSSFYGERRELLQCIPYNNLYGLRKILYDGGVHVDAYINDCPSCWLLKQPGAPKGTCKIHKSNQFESHLSNHLSNNNIVPSAPPLSNEKPNASFVNNEMSKEPPSYSEYSNYPNTEPPNIKPGNNAPSPPSSSDSPANRIICPICMAKEKSHSLIPCGHCFCSGCLEQNFSECPMCRCIIKDNLKIFV